MITERLLSMVLLCMLAFGASSTWADDYQDAINIFKKADASGKFFANSQGYAVFPTIAKGGMGVGGAYGKGKVFEKGKYIGDTSMTQLSVGLQLGAQGFSQIIFFQNADALSRFTKGEFELGAEASAVAITLAAGAKAGTTGATAGASVDKTKAKNVGAYNNGMAVFTVVKGGLMYEAAIAGQKFKTTRR